MKASSQNCFCAFCKSPRRIYRTKHITSTNVVLTAAAAVVLMFSLWQGFDPRVIVLFLSGLIFAEIFIQVRWRLSLTCPHCGFDPLLYMKKSQLAAEKVKAFYERRKQDPDFYLSGSPLLRLLAERRKAGGRQKRVRERPFRSRSKITATDRNKTDLLSRRL